MKLSVMLFPFHHDLAQGTLSPVTLAQTLCTEGATGVEAMSGFDQSHPAQWQDLLAALAGEGLQHVCLDVGGNLVFTDDAGRQAALDVVKRGVDTAAALDCPTVLFAGSCPPAGMSNEEGRQRYSEGLAMAAEYAVANGRVPTIEDFGCYPEFACHSTHVLEVVRGTGREDVRVVWDNGNFILADQDPLEAWEACAPLSVHVHIKDFALDPSGQAGLKTPSGKAYVGSDIGPGEARVADGLAAVKAYGYNSWVSVEVSVAPALEAAQQGCRCVRQCWGG